jgi:hypothetical protein
MHPVIAQAIAAERIRETRDHAAAARARQLRRSGHARRTWPFMGIWRAGRGPFPAPARRPLRGPRAA